MEQSDLTTIVLHIGGMTCTNCQTRIQTVLDHLDGVKAAEVRFESGMAVVTFDKQVISETIIIGEISALGYHATTRQPDRGKPVLRAILFSCIILISFALLQQFGVLNYLVPSQLADTGMGYGMLFVIGLITSVHCIAMCGGINLSQSLPTSMKEGQSRSRKQALLPALFYNLGRVISYTAVGFLLGLIGMGISGGSSLGISYFLQGILKIIAGVFMVIMGINMLGLFPGLRKLSVHCPAWLTRILRGTAGRPRTPFLVGLLNGLMPCGPLQSMQIIALASASPLVGALSMLAFSLGTVPLMLGLGSVVSLLGRKYADKVMTVGAVLVTVLGLAMLSQGGSLSGLFSSAFLLCCVGTLALMGVVSCIPFSKKGVRRPVLCLTALCAVLSILAFGIFSPAFLTLNGTGPDPVEIVDGVQVVHSTLSPGQYPNIAVQCGMPVKWIIEATEDDINGCNNRMLIEEYHLEYTFHEGENIITFTPERPGTFSYSCWMGMIHGTITVTE